MTLLVLYWLVILSLALAGNMIKPRVPQWVLPFVLGTGLGLTIALAVLGLWASRWTVGRDPGLCV
jgi:hypothetical protein